MKLFKLLFLPVFIFLAYTSAVAKDFDDSEIKHIGYPDWFVSNAFMDFPDQLEQAASTGKKGLMLLFTTEGCSYCSVFLHRSLGDPKISARTRKYFDSMGLEIFDDSEMVSPQGSELPVKQFAKQEGVQFSPTLLFYGLDGQRILRKTGYLSPERFNAVLDYIIGDHYKTRSLSAFLKSRVTGSASGLSETAKALLENRHFEKPPYALDRSRFSADRPLLVIFEKADCPECLDFHKQVLGESEVDKTLDQFQVVRLDINDSSTPVLLPSGQRKTPAGWYADTGFTRVPAWVLYDPDGNESMKTDALVLKQRMMNSLSYMLEEAYKKGWTYQRYARSQAIQRITSEKSAN